MIVKKNAGLWKLRLEIGNYCEDSAIKNEDLFIEFAGMNKDEVTKLKTFESSMLIEPEKGIKFDIDIDGKSKERVVAADIEEKRLNFFDNLLGKKILTHNFQYKDKEDDPGEAPKEMSKENVWNWVKERPSLFEFIVDQYRTQHPFFEKPKKEKGKATESK